MPGPRDYTRTTRAALAALSRGTCYYPGCAQRVIVFQEGEPYVNVQIAHVRDANAGNRHDASMSDDERRSFSNLILLCKPHHDLVDKRHPDRFSSAELLSWKVAREADEVVDDIDALVEDDLESALTAAAALTIEDGYLQIGGTGGSAPGAGGGGGGVLGSGTGGPGGHGGPVVVTDDVTIDLAGLPGTSPGAGGGGAGLLPPGSIARPREPADVSVGVGYSAGVDGADGQTSSFGDLTAPGGIGGRVGDRPRLKTGALRLSALTIANSVEIRDNLVFLLGGGWQTLWVVNLNETVHLPFVLLFEAGGVDAGDYSIHLSAENPHGNLMRTVTFPLTVETPGDVLRIPRAIVLDVSIDSFGLWRFSVHSEVQLLATFDLMVARLGTG